MRYIPHYGLALVIWHYFKCDSTERTITRVDESHPRVSTLGGYVGQESGLDLINEDLVALSLRLGRLLSEALHRRGSGTRS